MEGEVAGSAWVRAVCGRRTKWLVLAGWLVVAAVSVLPSTWLSGAQTSDTSEFLPGSAESVHAEHLQQRLPGRPAGLTAVVVFRDERGLSAAQRHAISGVMLRAARLPHVGRASAAQPSRDRKAVVYTVAVGGDQPQLADAVDALRSLVRSAGPPGVRAEVTGGAGFVADTLRALDGVDGRLLVATAALVAVLLMATYRSPLLWLLPLVAVGVAELASRAAAYGLAAGGLPVSGQAVGLLTVVLFGAGTDYALLLTARYREQLHRTADRHVAMAVALRQAAPPMLASAVTVGAALLCLLLAVVRVNRGFGPVAAAGILLALLSALTLYPALLLAVGRRAFWPRVPRTGAVEHTGRIWARIGERVAARPVRVWATVVVLLAAAGLGIATVNIHVTSADNLSPTAPSVRGLHLLERSLPPGEVSPLDVVVTDPAAAARVRRAVAASPYVAAVGPLRHGTGVTGFTAVPRSAVTGPAAVRVVTDVRHRVSAVAPGAALVGGAPARSVDIDKAYVRDATVVGPLVLAVVLVVLMLLLRAVVGPLVLTGTVVLSYAAAFGLGASLFRLVGFPGVDASVPLLTFLFLVALGVDYNIFLMSRVREEVTPGAETAGVVRGLAATGGVLTSAGLVLAGTFAVLTVLPLMATREIGVVVALGVLLDALVVRTVLVPALAVQMGRRFWWPARASHPAVVRRPRGGLRTAIRGPLVCDVPPVEAAALRRLALHGDRRVAVRASAVLAGTEPVPATQVAQRVGVRQSDVLRWCRRYRTGGLARLLR